MTRRALLTCIVGLCLAVSAAGQGPVRDFRTAKEAAPLLDFGNAALLATFGEGGISEAAGSFSKENGGIIPLEGSPDSWEASFETRSFRRVSPKLVFSGEVAYSYFRGKEMGAQILMDPGANAINFLEEDATTAATKKRETYLLRGGISWSFNDRLSAGLALDYKAGDQTKYKDPRFLNVLMDLSAAPGWAYRRPGFLIGANLLYRHRVEQLSAGNFGTVDHQYGILVDQGGFLGQREAFEGDIGYISVSNMRPLTDDRYGLAIQTSLGSRVQYFGQLSADWRTGYFGSRTSSTVVFCEFRGPEAAFEGAWLIPADDSRHRIDYGVEMKYLSKLTNSYVYKTEAGLSTKIEYTGQNETLTRLDLAARAAYKWEKGLSGYRPDWVLSASAEGFTRRQNTLIYPYSRHKDHLNLTADLAGERNVKTPSACFTFAAGLRFVWGTGDPKTDSSLSEGSTKLKSFDDWLYRQYEYDTAARAGGSLSFTWSLLRFGRLVPYLKLSDRFVSLLSEPEYLQGRTRNEAALTLGINF